MSKRIKSKTPQQRDYRQMLKDYFGFHLTGLDVKEVGGQMQAQVIYNDFKHIDTVRRDLAMMMPEVEFTKLRREYTVSAQTWALSRLLTDDYEKYAPIIYIKRGDSLVKSTLRDIAMGELSQLEIDADDEKEIGYDEFESQIWNDEELKMNSWE